MNHNDDADKYVGFRSYQIDGKVVVDGAQIDAMHNQKRFCLNSSNIKQFAKKPKPKTWRWHLKEWRYRLHLAWAALRYGRDYFD
jgi:hypothetical protein